VSIWNRTTSRAEALARELGAEAVASPEPAGIVVNTTSVGMGGEAVEALPVAGVLSPETTVVDFVYHERGTALLRAAEAAGCETVDGLELLVRQGAISLELWTGRRPDLDVMRAAARA
jgi:shikimate dehydrogenase